MGPKAAKKTHLRPPDVMYGYASLFLHETIPTVLQKKPFNFRRNTQTMKGMPGASYSDGTVKLFTYEIAFDLGVDRTGPKEQVLNRLRDYLSSNPSKIPDFIAEQFDTDLYESAKKNDESLKTALEQYHDAVSKSKESGGQGDEVKLPQVLLFLYHRLQKNGIAPKTEKFICAVSGHKLTKLTIEPALAEIDTSHWNSGNVDPSSNLVVQRRSPACTARLFTLLLVDDKHCRRLLYKMPGNFWQMVCKDFINDKYEVPAIPVEDPVFLDPDTETPYGISTCRSRWVKPETLAWWYDTTHMLLAAARRRFYAVPSNRTAHDLKTLDGIKAFIDTIKVPHLIQLVLLAWWRWGTDEVMGEWFAPRDDDDDDLFLVTKRKDVDADDECQEGCHGSEQDSSLAARNDHRNIIAVSTGRKMELNSRNEESLDQEAERNLKRLKRAHEYLELSKIVEDSGRQKKLQQVSYAIIDKVIEVECSQLGINADDLELANINSV